MRLILYGAILVLCCATIQYSSAESRDFKKPKYSEDDKDKGDKKYKNKHKTDIDDESSEENGKISKYSNRKLKLEHPDSTNDKKYTKKSKKFEESEEEEEAPGYKTNKRNKDRKDEAPQNKHARKKALITEEDDETDTEEDTAIRRKQKTARSNKKSKQNEDDTLTQQKKNNKLKKNHNSDEDDSDEDTSEEKPVLSDESDDEESVEDAPKKQFRKKIRVRVPDSPENDSHEMTVDHGTCEKQFKGGKKGQKKCTAAERQNGSGETDQEPTQKKKIKYSIKFAHEKQKNSPSEDDNIMKKIHRGEKKKYKYQDDDDDSSEEHTHPKRIRFIDEDDD